MTRNELTQQLTAPSALLTSLILLSGPTAAQKVAPMAPIPGPVKHAGTYHVATGEWTRQVQLFGGLAQDALYRNDMASSYFGLLDQEEFAHDEGRLPGEGQPLAAGGTTFGTADRYAITGFEVGYCALDSAPVTYTLGFFESYAPCSNPTILTPIATLVATGIPNNGCWVVAFDLTGTTAAFTLDAEGGNGTWSNDESLDNFGYFLNIDGGQGNATGQITHGPMLAGNHLLPDTLGDGTIFQNPANSGTGLGSSDLFWLQRDFGWPGCYFFGGCLPCANFHSVFYGEEDEVTTGVCFGNGNSVSPEGATLEAVGGFGTSSATFHIGDAPQQPGLLFSGPSQGQVPFGCGERCVVGSGTVRYGPYNVGGSTSQQFSVTIDMSVSSNSNVQYWYRDPANSSSCGSPFNLSNAVGL